MSTPAEDKLRRSVERGMLEALAPFGFRITDVESSHRGDALTMANDSVRLELSADWLEGEVGITVHITGGASLDLFEIIDPPKGAGLSRLSRGVTVRTLGSRLAKIGQSLATSTLVHGSA